MTNYRAKRQVRLLVIGLSIWPRTQCTARLSHAVCCVLCAACLALQHAPSCRVTCSNAPPWVVRASPRLTCHQSACLPALLPFCVQWGTFSAEDACNFGLNIYDDGAILSIGAPSRACCGIAVHRFGDVAGCPASVLSQAASASRAA